MEYKKIKYMNGLFFKMFKFKILLFSKSSKLKNQKLPDISKWNTCNIKCMNGLFYGCSSLMVLPDISKSNINKVKELVAYFLNVLLYQNYMV